MGVLLLVRLPFPPKLSKYTKADQYQRRLKADTLQDGFEFIFRTMQHTALEGFQIDWAEGKVRGCFRILSAWVVDYMKKVTLHGLKANACPTSEVPSGELGTNIKNYQARDYAGYE